MADIPRPAIRRPLSMTVLSLTFLALLVLTPIVLPILAIVDLATRAPMRRSRVWLIVLTILGNEAVGTVIGLGMIVFHAGRLNGAVAQQRFHRLMMSWGGRHLTILRVFGGLHWVIDNPVEVEAANAIVLARHASHADAILPILLFGNVGGHHIRYTLKNDLQWSPAMDIVGNRMGHVFLDRTPGPGSPLLQQIHDLAGGINESSVAVIFPEGTFYTAERLDRAAHRIAETRPELESACRSLEYLLPPRPAGTRALMEGAPDADLVLVAHEGMEPFGDLADIRANVPLKSPVRVRLWRVARAEVPMDEDEFTAWLLDRWIEMDQWIQKRVRQRTDGNNEAVGTVIGREFRP